MPINSSATMLVTVTPAMTAGGAPCDLPCKPGTSVVFEVEVAENAKEKTDVAESSELVDGVDVVAEVDGLGAV
jgi:hypothetical protein